MELRGTVKWFDTRKGFGFIEPEDGGKDVFVHHSGIQRGFNGLRQGNEVEFDVEQEDRGPKATRVKRIQRGPENITYGTQEATPQQVIEAAKAAELHDFILSLPEKYETAIGERGTSLSGGQRQRMAFAMALLTDPTVLILDDTTSALDAETEARIQRTLDKIMVGRTSFTITHRMSTAMKADLILVLDKGRMVERGTHEELMAKRGMYYKVFRQQLGEET